MLTSRAAISNLFFLRSPTAVTRFVIPIVVDTFYGKLPIWFLSNISQKYLKILPFFTDFYASSAIVAVGPMRVVGAAPPHSSPTIVFGGIPATAATMKQSRFSKSIHISHQATTTLRHSINEALPQDNLNFPAVALTQPLCIATAIISGTFDHFQSCKSLAFEITKVYRRMRTVWISKHLLHSLA